METQKNDKYATDLIKGLLTYLGEDAGREGLVETPQRVIKMYKELFSGYNDDIVSIFKTFESNGYHELITVANISFYSLCEHHMIPF